MAGRQPARFAYPSPPSFRPTVFDIQPTPPLAPEPIPPLLLPSLASCASPLFQRWGGQGRGSTRRRINLCAIPFYSIPPLPFEIGGENFLVRAGRVMTINEPSGKLYQLIHGDGWSWRLTCGGLDPFYVTALRPVLSSSIRSTFKTDRTRNGDDDYRIDFEAFRQSH